MTDEIVDTTARRFDGGVEFLMKDGDRTVTVRVSKEALAGLENGRKAHPNYTEVFEHHRYAIEGVARRKLKSELFEEGWSLMLTGDDLQG
jgi:hypothetical protein